MFADVKELDGQPLLVIVHIAWSLQHKNERPLTRGGWNELK